MKPIAIIQHNAEVPPGYLYDAVVAADVPIKLVRLDLRDPLPDLENISGIVSLGGIMGAYEDDEHSFLAPEKEYLRSAVDQNVPVLGICLGCQLLADALGGRAYRGSSHEVEFGALQIAKEAMEDPVVGPLAEPVLSFHSDTFDPPPGVEILATSSRYPHAFRCGSAVAIQSHPEADAEIAREWVELYGREKLRAEGVDAAELIASIAAAAAGTARRAAQLFGAWLGEVIATQR